MGGLQVHVNWVLFHYRRVLDCPGDRRFVPPEPLRPPGRRAVLNPGAPARPPGVCATLGGGRIWRYELEPQGDATLVRESWDISEEKVKAIVRPAANKTREAMKKTLERIAAIVAS